MFAWLTGKATFTLRTTHSGFFRWNRLINKLGYRYQDENEVLYRALSFYGMVVVWKDLPLFTRSIGDDLVVCNLARDYVSGPKENWAYRRKYTVPVSQWVVMKHLLKQSGAENMSHLIERALELYERLVEGWLPELYTLDDFGEFTPFRFATPKAAP
jgi:hypothetical protein